MISNPRFRPEPWPVWKRIARVIWTAFEWGDHEYLRFTLGKWPYTMWITVYEPSWRRGIRRVFPWRIRFAWAGLLRDAVCRYCTVCGKKITLRELIERPGQLLRFPSGSACHQVCSGKGGAQ